MATKMTDENEFYIPWKMTRKLAREIDDGKSIDGILAELQDGEEPWSRMDAFRYVVQAMDCLIHAWRHNYDYDQDPHPSAEDMAVKSGGAVYAGLDYTRPARRKSKSLQQYEGENAVVISHFAMAVLTLEMQVDKFKVKVEPPEPDEPNSKPRVRISYLRPGDDRRPGECVASYDPRYPHSVHYLTVERDGVVLYDSRLDTPFFNMDNFNRHREEFNQHQRLQSCSHYYKNRKGRQSKQSKEERQ